MVKTLASLGDRLLGLIVPQMRAAACRCWMIDCELDDGTVVPRECCRIGAHLYCDPCPPL
jgi:hypothetical protein